MGIIRMGPPRDLILRFQAEHDIDQFIETGTFRGETAKWAADHFKQVTTIEYSRELYDETVARLGKTPNIDFRFGDSRAVLREISPTLRAPSVIWLDGHWSGGKTCGDKDECPLLDELEALKASPSPPFLFVDDARLFLAPPPPPHDVGQWPSIDQVTDAIKARQPEVYIAVVEDVLVAVPPMAKALLVQHCREVAARADAEYGRRAVRQGWRSIVLGGKQIVSGLRFR